MSTCLKILGAVNHLIGLTCLIAQIISYIDRENNLLTIATSAPSSSPAFNEVDLKVTSDYTPTVDTSDTLKPPGHYGAGIWGGVIFIVTGIIAIQYAYLTRSKPSMRLAVVAFGALSIGCGIALIVISGVNLSTLKKFGDCLVNPNECTCENYFEGSFCKTTVQKHYTIYNAVFISSGIAAIITNIFLILAVVCMSCRKSSQTVY